MTRVGEIPKNADPATSNHVWPPGICFAWAGDPASPPAGWLLLRGQSITKASQPGLNAIIGDGPGAGQPGYHAYNGGVDPGGGNLKLPDFRQAIPCGPGTGRALGARGGQKRHVHAAGTLAADHTHGSGTLALPDHAHGHNLTTGSHEHTTPETNKTIIRGTDGFARRNFGGATQNDGGFGVGGGVFGSGAIGTTGSSAAASTTAITGTSGAADPPYVVVNFIAHV